MATFSVNSQWYGLPNNHARIFIVPVKEDAEAGSQSAQKVLEVATAHLQQLHLTPAPVDSWPSLIGQIQSVCCATCVQQSLLRNLSSATCSAYTLAMKPISKDSCLLPDDDFAVRSELERMEAKIPKAAAAGEKWVPLHMQIAEKRGWAIARASQYSWNQNIESCFTGLCYPACRAIAYTCYMSSSSPVLFLNFPFRALVSSAGPTMLHPMLKSSTSGINESCVPVSCV